MSRESRSFTKSEEYSNDVCYCVTVAGGAGIDLGGLATLWKGMILQVRMTQEMKLSLNFDISNCGFYKHIALTSAVDLICGGGSSNNTLHSKAFEVLSSELVSIYLLTYSHNRLL